MNNAEFLRLAYERTIILELKRHLMERYVGGGGSSTESLTCEDVPFHLRTVPLEAITYVVERLQQEDTHLTTEMSHYDFRRQELRPLARPVRPNQPVDDPGADDGTDPETR
jgi:hypothetical protein